MKHYIVTSELTILNYKNLPKYACCYWDYSGFFFFLLLYIILNYLVLLPCWGVVKHSFIHSFILSILNYIILYYIQFSYYYRNPFSKVYIKDLH